MPKNSFSDAVYAAASAVLKEKGTLVVEGTILGLISTLVGMPLEGRWQLDYELEEPMGTECYVRFLPQLRVVGGRETVAIGQEHRGTVLKMLGFKGREKISLGEDIVCMPVPNWGSDDGWKQEYELKSHMVERVKTWAAEVTA